MKNCSLKYVLLMVAGLWAGFSSPLSASDYYLLTDVGASAETIGHGTVEGFDKNSGTIFENPAGLYRIKNNSASFFTTTFMNEIQYTNLSFATTSPYGVFGIGMMEYRASGLYNTGVASDETLYSIDTFDYKNSIYKLSYANSLSRSLHYGANFSIYSVDTKDVSGRGGNLDLGLVLNSPSTELSLMLRNAIPFTDVVYADGTKERLPYQLVAGVKQQVGMFSGMGQAKVNEGKVLLSTGMVFTPSNVAPYQLMGGYRQFITQQNENKSTFSLGITLILGGIHLAYAYEKSDYFEYDNKNFFSVSINDW